MDRLPLGAYDAQRAFRALEPIIKGYVRAGAYVGEGAWVDHAFNSIDVCIVMPTERLSARYAQRFERGLARASQVAATPARAPVQLARAG
jgi:putative hemolysin